jgi:hypothetical protein
VVHSAFAVCQGRDQRALVRAVVRQALVGSGVEGIYIGGTVRRGKRNTSGEGGV